MRQIVAISPDGHEKLYQSIAEFRKEYKASSPTINRALQSGQPLKRGRLKGWRFEYYNFEKEVLDTALKEA